MHTQWQLPSSTAMDSRFSLEIIDSTELLRAKRERERVIDIEKDI